MEISNFEHNSSSSAVGAPGLFSPFSTTGSLLILFELET